MKKRNRVLEILACTALAAVIFLGYMFTAQDNGRFEIEDIEGDRTHLADFVFEGIAGDETGQVHYIWQDGELKTDYYAGSTAQVDDVLYQKKQGKNIISQYFRQLNNTLYPTPDLEAAPSAGAEVQTFDKLDDLPAEIRTEVEQEVQGREPYELKAAVMDSVDIFAEVNDYEKQKTTRYFTGLQLTGKEYYFADVEFNNGGVRMGTGNHVQNYGISSVDMGDAWYTITNTDATCEGEIYLNRIPKDGMISMYETPQEHWDDLYYDATYGETEIIKTFPVNGENRIISMERAGKDRLLLAVTENDNLILELYDLEGNRLHQLDAGVPNVSSYELNTVEMIQRDEQLVLWFGLSRRVQTDEMDEESFHYEVDGTKYYVVEEDEIRAVQAEDHLGYFDVQNGKVLQMKGFAPEHLAIKFYGYMYVGYDITVTDEKTGELLYHGRLVTDFAEDYNRRLTAVNIGEQAGNISERENPADWEKYNAIRMAERNVGGVYPMEGRFYYTGWNEGYDWGYMEGDYYYH
ncbi:hypothetical protein [Anaerotignum sp.]